MKKFSLWRLLSVWGRGYSIGASPPRGANTRCVFQLESVGHEPRNMLRSLRVIGPRLAGQARMAAAAAAVGGAAYGTQIYCEKSKTLGSVTLVDDKTTPLDLEIQRKLVRET